jgi:hypothetical protein
MTRKSEVVTYLKESFVNEEHNKASYENSKSLLTCLIANDSKC